MPNAKILRFVQLGRRQQCILVEALAALGASSAAARFLPFRWSVRMGSRKLSRKVQGGCDCIRDVHWGIEVAAAGAPWRAVCLQKGLALQWMLRRRGIDALLHYGLAKEKAGKLEAHVWVSVGDKLVIGGEIASKFHCVASFPQANAATTAF